jgi:hypothetical protein
MVLILRCRSGEKTIGKTIIGAWMEQAKVSGAHFRSFISSKRTLSKRVELEGS